MIVCFVFAEALPLESKWWLIYQRPALGMEAPPFFHAEMDYFGPLNVKQDWSKVWNVMIVFFVT